jgi:hypothetical protein
MAINILFFEFLCVLQTPSRFYYSRDTYNTPLKKEPTLQVL